MSLVSMVSKMKFRQPIPALVFLLMLLAGVPCAFSEESATQQSGGSPNADQAAQLFSQKCTGCHTIGKGKLVGPDLTEVASWSPAEISQAVNRMQKFVGSLKEDEIKSLVEFLKDQKAPARLAAASQAQAPQAAKKELASADTGGKLFFGKTHFQNGGMACMSCHQVDGQGGSLGPDLSNIYQKMGQAPLTSACEQTSFPVMREVYKDHAVTHQEALDLVAYFSEVNGKKPSAANPPVGELGLAGALAALLAIAFFYRKRNSGVRAKLKRR